MSASARTSPTENVFRWGLPTVLLLVSALGIGLAISYGYLDTATLSAGALNALLVVVIGAGLYLLGRYLISRWPSLVKSTQYDPEVDERKRRAAELRAAEKAVGFAGNYLIPKDKLKKLSKGDENRIWLTASFYPVAYFINTTIIAMHYQQDNAVFMAFVPTAVILAVLSAHSVAWGIRRYFASMSFVAAYIVSLILELFVVSLEMLLFETTGLMQVLVGAMAAIVVGASVVFARAKYRAHEERVDAAREIILQKRAAS